MSVEQRPGLEQVTKDFHKAHKSLGRAHDLLANPGGSAWPPFYQLTILPTETVQQQDEFIRKSARVADRFVPKIAQIAGRLETKVEDLHLQVAEGRLEVIKASVERRQQGQPGLPDEVLQKAEVIVEDLKARRDRRLQEAQPPKPSEPEPLVHQKAARRKHIEREVLDGVRLRDIGGRLADVAEILNKAQGNQLTRREIATAVWPDMPIEQALRNLTATLNPQNRQQLQDQGVEVRHPLQEGGKSILELVRFGPTTKPPQITEQAPSVPPVAPASEEEQEKK